MDKEFETTLITEEDDDEAFDEEFIDTSYMFFSTPLRLLILLGATLLISVFYKSLIEIGLFRLIRSAGAHRFVYCVFELLLLGGFWYGVFIFSKKCKHRSHSLRAHYLMTSIVAVVYTGICCGAYYFLSWNIYSLLFRITFNLCGLRFRTTFPANRTPYLIAYLIITVLIMLLEPTIAKKLYKRRVRRKKGKVGPLERKIIAFLDERYEKKEEKAVRKKIKWKQKRRRRKLKQEERYQKRKAKWKMKKRKRREKEKKKAMKKQNR